MKGTISMIMKIYKYMNSKDEDNSGINEAKSNNYRRDNSTIFIYIYIIGDPNFNNNG